MNESDMVELFTDKTLKLVIFHDLAFLYGSIATGACLSLSEPLNETLVTESVMTWCQSGFFHFIHT